MVGNRFTGDSITVILRDGIVVDVIGFGMDVVVDICTVPDGSFTLMFDECGGRGLEENLRRGKDWNPSDRRLVGMVLRVETADECLIFVFEATREIRLVDIDLSGDVKDVGVLCSACDRVCVEGGDKEENFLFF